MPHPSSALTPPTLYDTAVGPELESTIFADWLRHVEAGRIGGNPPMSEAVRAGVLAAEAVLCPRRAGVW